MRGSLYDVSTVATQGDGFEVENVDECFLLDPPYLQDEVRPGSRSATTTPKDI